MFRRLQIATLTVMAISFGAPALAQDAGRVLEEIGRTDGRIEQARTVVSGSDNERARMTLASAITLQDAAKRYYASSQFPLAARSTMDARMRADAAIAIVRGQPDPERVRSQVERTRELIERARPRVEECTDERVRALLRGASEMQDRAEAALAGQRGLAALRLTLSARERAWRALRLCHFQEEPGEGAERALHRTDEVIDRARQELADGESPRAEVAMRQAGDLQQRAWAEFRAGHQEACLRLTQSARTAAHRAMRFSSGGR